jgi:hypothetical protein
MSAMMKTIIEAKNEKCRTFQVLLLNNNAKQEVEVQEAEEVDFLRVQEHLRHGGSVFITSKRSQKIALPKEKKKARRSKSNSRRGAAFCFNHM